MPRYECSMCGFEMVGDEPACPQCGNTDRLTHDVLHDRLVLDDSLEQEISGAIRSVAGLTREELLTLEDAVRETLSGRVVGSLVVTEEDGALAAEGVVINAAPAEATVQASPAMPIVTSLEDSLGRAAGSSAFAPVIAWWRERRRRNGALILSLVVTAVLHVQSSGAISRLTEDVADVKALVREALADAEAQGCTSHDDLKQLILHKAEQLPHEGRER